MKFQVFLLSIFFINSCSLNISRDANNLTRPVVKISSPANSLIESNISVAKLPANIPPFPTPQANEFNKKQFIENIIEGSSKNFGLSRLEKTKFSQDDLEIRVWQISDLYMPIYNGDGVSESVFVLKRLNEKWSARILRNTVKFVNEDKFEKTLKTNLSEPEVGWEEYWKKLTNADILILPDGEDVGATGGFHSPLFIVEAKVGENYRFYMYGESPNGETVREVEQTLVIMNLIADEFNAPDFKTRPPKIDK